MIRHPAFWCLLLLPMSAPALADTLYRYQQPDGTWAFTDRPLSGQTAVSETPLDTASPLPQSGTGVYGLRIHRNERGLFVQAYNRLGGPLHFKLRPPDSAPLPTEPELPLDRVVPAGGVLPLAELLAPPVPGQGIPYDVTPGDPAAVHRPEAPYRLPFFIDDRYRVSQAFNGAFSHNHDGSRYAVDIYMPEGSLVCAARAGTVMAVEHGNYQGGTDRQKYIRKANLIRILHDDGTIATYAHLTISSIRVQVGDRVQAGQRIARSGNTGYSSGPHLHFVVQRNDGEKLISVPFEFTTGTPYRGQWLSFDE